MKTLVRVLGIPLIAEIANSAIYNVFVYKPEAAPLGYPAGITFLITLTLLFYVGWRAAQSFRDRPLLKSAGCGLLLWFISTLLVGGMSRYFGLDVPSSQQDFYLGPLIAFALFAPIAAVFPVLGAWSEMKISNLRRAK
jgi:hypothetical protein